MTFKKSSIERQPSAYLPRDWATCEEYPWRENRWRLEHCERVPPRMTPVGKCHRVFHQPRTRRPWRRDPRRFRRRNGWRVPRGIGTEWRWPIERGSPARWKEKAETLRNWETTWFLLIGMKGFPDALDYRLLVIIITWDQRKHTLHKSCACHWGVLKFHRNLRLCAGNDG